MEGGREGGYQCMTPFRSNTSVRHNKLVQTGKTLYVCHRPMGYLQDGRGRDCFWMIDRDCFWISKGDGIREGIVRPRDQLSG